MPPERVRRVGARHRHRTPRSGRRAGAKVGVLDQLDAQQRRQQRLAAARAITYAALGVLFGLAGKTLLLAGLQRGLTIFAGVAILAGGVFFLLRRRRASEA